MEASLPALWAVVAVLSVTLVGVMFVLAGVLRELGVMRSELGLTDISASRPRPSVIPLQDDGPAIGSRLDQITMTAVDGARVEAPLGHTTLLAFLSATCPGCQEAVAGLNALAEGSEPEARPIVILRAALPACRAFLNVFPLNMPVVCDAGELTMGFGVHRNPFGLAYNSSGVLRQKAIIENEAQIRALLALAGAQGDTSNTL